MDDTFRKLSKIEISIYYFLCILMTFCGIISMALTILFIILNALYNSMPVLFIEVACVA